MNLDRIADRLAANRGVTNADGPGNETEVPKAVETAQAFQERHCELFEGGLGI
jgi:hypothetical protein